MAEPPRRSRRLRGETPEVVSVADLLRRACRLRGDPPEEVRPHYEGLKILVTRGGSRILSPEEGDSSLVVHSDYQGLETGYDP